MSEPYFSISSKISLISKSLLLITVISLSFTLISSETPKNYGNSKDNLLRQLSARDGFYTFLSIFNYLYPIFFILALSGIINLQNNKEFNNSQNDIFIKTLFLKVFYIINIGYIFTSGLYFFNYDKENIYMVIIFIISFGYLVAVSLVFLKDCLEGPIKCFIGICQWDFLISLANVPSLVCLIPCASENCCCCLCCGPGNENGGDFCFNLCASFCLFLGFVFTLFNTIVYYMGFSFYSISWLIGKFFIYVFSPEDSWLRAEVDPSVFNLTETKNTPLNVPEQGEKGTEDEEDNRSVKQKMKKNYIIVEKTIKVRYKRKKPN